MFDILVLCNFRVLVSAHVGKCIGLVTLGRMSRHG